MLEKFVPDIYQKSIYDINYDTLKKRGIKCLIFDLDNTLVPVTVKKPTKKVLNGNDKASYNARKDRIFAQIDFIVKNTDRDIYYFSSKD